MAYLFTHFIGEGPNEEQIYFSISRDGLHWNDLNDSKPVICSDQGEKGLRDPFMIRKEDGSGFVIISTDLCIAAGKGWEAAVETGSRSLVITESKDLIHWSRPVLAETAPEKAGCAWAPEAVYDRENRNYMVFWASKIRLDGEEMPKHRIYCSRTEDFHSFTPAEIYLERENDVIDTTMVYSNGMYYRFSKDEVTKHIRTDCSNSLDRDSFRGVDVPVLDAIYGVEGPEIYYIDELKGWCLIIDRYSEHKGYLPLICSDLEKMDFRVLEDSEFSMGKTTKRHGSVIVITDEEYEKMAAAFGLQ